MKGQKLLVLALLVLVGAGVLVLARRPGRVDGDARLLLYCGAGLRPPVAEIAAAFEAETGTSLEIIYGASNLLLGQLALSGRGDLFLPGDDYYLAAAAGKGLAEAGRPLAEFVPVIIVARGNPRNVGTLDDLAGPGLRLGLADGRSAAIGRLAGLILERAGLDRDALAANLVYTSATVHELAGAVALGHVDAAIVWRPVAAAHATDTDMIPIDPAVNITAPVAIARLTTTTRPEAAARFIEFIASERGRAVFTAHHYDRPPD